MIVSKCEIKTEVGNSHTVTFNSEDFENNFKKVHAAVKKQATGDMSCLNISIVPYV